MPKPNDGVAKQQSPTSLKIPEKSWPIKTAVIDKLMDASRPSPPSRFHQTISKGLHVLQI